MLQEPTSDAKELTEEEIAQIKLQQDKFYDAELPLLRKQAEYEELSYKIEEYAYRRMVAIRNKAMFFAEMKEMQEQADKDPITSIPEKQD